MGPALPRECPASHSHLLTLPTPPLGRQPMVWKSHPLSHTYVILGQSHGAKWKGKTSHCKRNLT